MKIVAQELSGRFFKVVVFSLLIVAAIVPTAVAQEKRVRIADISSADQSEFDSIRKAFTSGNPGYDLNYYKEIEIVKSSNNVQVLFVQEIEGVTDQERIANVMVSGGSNAVRESQAIVGDIIILYQKETMVSDKALGLLVFAVPKEPKQELPSFIRPDWDPDITDIPGGCATEIDDYRRILLTWTKDVGKYVYHALNAHRVRIRDSFSHYHPVKGGFDEFYLVQMAEPEAKIFTSVRTALITDPERIRKQDVDGLIEAHHLKTGYLVYIPKGVIHRGFGGALVHVITVPGFIPGSEIGVDHHLRAINERFGLKRRKALPFNREFSASQVIR